MKNLYLFLCIICLMLFGMANTPANTFDFGSLKLNDRPYLLLSKVVVPTPKITASSTTICKGSKVTLTATACTNGVLKWTDGLEGNSIIVSPTATKSYRVLCKLNSAPAGSASKSDSSLSVTITVNPVPVAPKITSNTICNNPVSVLGDISFGGENTDYLSSTCLSQDGSLVMVGNSTSSNNGDKSQASKGGSDYWVVKVNAVGTKVWDKTFGGSGDDAPTSILATSDGGFLISGYSNSPKSGDKSEASKGGYDYWLVKIDANGTKVWDKAFGGTGADYATTIIATTDNNFLITGHSDSGIGGNKSVGTKGSLDYWIVKIKPDGTKLWDKSYGGSGIDNLVSVVSTKEGGFLLAGHSSSLSGGDKTESSKGNYDYWVLKIDANGTKLWDKSYGALSQEELSSITPTFDGGFILGGISNSSIGGDKTEPLMGGFDYWIVKIDGNGTKLWDKVFGGSETEYFAKVLPTADGGCLLGGTSYSPISGNKFEASLNGDFWLVKISSNGSRAWDKVIGGNSADVLKDMFLSDDGKVVLNGYSFSDAGSSKRQPSRGSSDYWIAQIEICDNSYKPYTNLVATGCTGVVTWSNNATGSTITVSPIVATNFTAICKVNGCTSLASNTVIVNPPKPATPSIAASSTSVCEGSPVVLSSSNSMNGTITWTGGTKGSSITIYPTTTKTYKSICNVNSINSDSSRSITITVLPKPTQPKITASNSTICAGSSTTLTASACTGGVLTWTGGLTGSSITVFPTKTTIYKALCTVNTCKSDSSVAVTINVIAKPSAPTITKSLNNSVVKQWDKTIGGNDDENLKIIVATQDGGFIFGGDSNSGVSGEKTQVNKGGQDYWVVKIDANGNKLWDKTFGGSSEDNLQSIVAINDGGFILGGYSQSGISGDKTQASKGASDYWIVKIDANGNKIWDKSFGGNNQDNLQSIVASNDGGFILGGDSWYGSLSGDKTQNSRGTVDYWIVKIDANGNKLWDKSFGGDLLDNLQYMVALKDGGFLLGGNSYSGISGEKTQNTRGVNDYDYWVVRIDANGNKLWDKTLGGISNDYLQSIVVTNDSGFILGGYTFSGISGDKTQSSRGAYDYWIVKIDATGNKVWDKTFGGNGFEYLESIIPSKNGGFILGGYSGSGISGDKTEASKIGDDYWLVKIDANGNKLWDKAFGGDNYEYLRSAVSINDSEFIIGGSSESNISGDKTQDSRSAYGKGSFSWDYWILKIKENQSTTLTVTGCTGTVNWSNGATTNSITVSPTVATTYTATCTVNTCKSVASNAITVSPDVIPNARVETNVAIEPEPSFNFKVFPNPAKDELTIQTDLEGEATFYLYNNIGQKVLEKTFEKQTKIDLKNLSKGSHFYSIEHQEIKTNGKVLLE